MGDGRRSKRPLIHDWQALDSSLHSRQQTSSCGLVRRRTAVSVVIQFSSVDMRETMTVKSFIGSEQVGVVEVRNPLLVQGRYDACGPVTMRCAGGGQQGDSAYNPSRSQQKICR